MDHKARVLLEAGVEALGKQIRAKVKEQAETGHVPCELGTRLFSALVRDYWRLCDIMELSAGELRIAPVEEEVCEAEPERG